MNRVEIKELARKKIKGNIWNLLWPLLCIMVISGLAYKIGGGTATYDVNTMKVTTNSVSPTATIISTIIELLIVIITAGYSKYLLNFVRTNKFDTNEIINTVKEKWLNIIIATILVGIIVGIGIVFCIVPGIILSLAYTFVTLLIIDSDISGVDALKKSREMMKGYKLDYFVFTLSFLGWYILSIFTFGILLIWVIPYFNVANTIYYEKLKEKTK